jgi:hypothetical protein
VILLLLLQSKLKLLQRETRVAEEAPMELLHVPPYFIAVGSQQLGCMPTLLAIIGILQSDCVVEDMVDVFCHLIVDCD